jgi:hypothetical protein
MKFLPILVSGLAAVSFSVFAQQQPSVKTDNDPTVQGQGNAKLEKKSESASTGASSDKPASGDKPRKVKKAKRSKDSKASTGAGSDQQSSAGSPGGK